MIIAIINRPKGLKILKTELSVTDRRTDGPTDGRTDGRTHGRTDKPAYRDANPREVLFEIYQKDLNGLNNTVSKQRNLAQDAVHLLR